MTVDRRGFLLGSLGAAALIAPARAEPLTRYGLDAAQFGVHVGAPDDQSAKLQKAIDQAGQTRTPLVLAPGRYHVGNLRLPAGAQIAGVRGATQLILTQGPSLIAAEHTDDVSLSGLTLDGGGATLPAGRGLMHLIGAGNLLIENCTIQRAGGNGLSLVQCAGSVTGCTMTDAADNAVFSLDARGLTLRGNSISGSGNGGIRIWQSDKRHDGSLVADNRITDTHAKRGGTGENGNAINVFRAANVIVRNNSIVKAAFSAIRGNAASEVQVLGNNCSGLAEVAIYAEFDFEGAVIADNNVDGAALGVSVTNFNKGGRLGVVQGNLIRNLLPKRPQGGSDSAGIGIAVEADTAVTGNVVENAPRMGISVGTGRYQRDIAVTGNVVRKADIGIGVSVVPGAGRAVITGNVIEDAPRGAIVGMAWDKPVTGDLSKTGTANYPQLTIADNRVS